jgi:hypothetical protein
MQDAGAEGCEHWLGQLAEPLPDVQPGGHHVQAAAPAAENWRSVHATHVAALDAPVAAEKVPATQATMSDPTTLGTPSPPPPGQNWPAEQVACTLGEPGATNQPAATTQTAAPSPEVAPVAQRVQFAAPAAAKLPALQSVGAARLRAPQNAPAVHGVHEPPVKFAALWNVPGKKHERARECGRAAHMQASKQQHSHSTQVVCSDARAPARACGMQSRHAPMGQK